MEPSGVEPRLSSYLHAKACRDGTPLAGNFEITPRCNFNCRMCYVHLTEEQQRARGSELSADEWLAIAEKARAQGMLFLLLTGGEPLMRQDLRYLLTELKKMGLLISINSNGSLINDEWLEFFRREPPFRFNITLYGCSDRSYRELCGNPAYEKVISNIRELKKMGIGVKLNASMTPYNICDLERIYETSESLGAPVQVATYMFPPTRRDEKSVGKNDRFTPAEAAGYSVMWDRLRLSPEQFKMRAEAMARGAEIPGGEAGEGTPGEKISCRAGRSSFWINWRGDMTPCGMMNSPVFSVRELGFDEAWKRTKEATAEIRMPSECASCGMKHVCRVCAAMCVTETGRFDRRPEYICEMTRETVRLTIQEKD